MSATHVVGDQLPNGATVISVSFAELPDGSTLEEMHDSADNHTRTWTPAHGSPGEVRAKLEERLRFALVDNATFLMAAPDDQVNALTRQVDALIRLALGRYDTDKGT